MTWTIAFYQGLVQLAASSLLLLLVASVVVLAIRQPARRIRVIEWTLCGLLLLPWFAFLPGYPRWSILPKLDPPTSPPVATAQTTEPAGGTETRPIVASEPNLEPPQGTNDEVPSMLNEPPTAVTADGGPAVARIAITPSPPVPATPRPKWEVAFPRDFRFWIVAAYLLGVGGMALWSLVGLIALGRVLRFTRPAGRRVPRSASPDRGSKE